MNALLEVVACIIIVVYLLMGKWVFPYIHTHTYGECCILTRGLFTSILPFFPRSFQPLLFPFCSQVRTLVVEDKALHTAGDHVLRVVSLANAYVQ